MLVSLRNDVAHVFGRAFGPPRKGQNVPSFNGGLRIAGYDPSTDIVATGTDPEASTRLLTAIKRVFELYRLAQLIHHGLDESAYLDNMEPVEVLIQAARDEISRSRTR